MQSTHTSGNYILLVRFLTDFGKIRNLQKHFRNTPVPPEKETQLFFLYLAHQQRVKDGKADVKEEPKSH